MRLRVVLGALLLVLAATACGSGTTASTPRQTKPAKEVVRVVGTDDSGATVELRVGESIRVELESEYRPATARPSGSLERTYQTGGYPSGQPMVAVFTSKAAGRADIESSTDFACLHATPSCALPQQLWSVHVVVKAS
jgi:hypothetical protein